MKRVSPKSVTSTNERSTAFNVYTLSLDKDRAGLEDLINTSSVDINSELTDSDLPPLLDPDSSAASNQTSLVSVGIASSRSKLSGPPSRTISSDQDTSLLAPISQGTIDSPIRKKHRPIRSRGYRFVEKSQKPIVRPTTCWGTPIHFAIAGGDVACVTLLLKAGARVDCTGGFYQPGVIIGPTTKSDREISALDFAVKLGKMELIDAIYSHMGNKFWHVLRFLRLAMVEQSPFSGLPEDIISIIHEKILVQMEVPSENLGSEDYYELDYQS